MKKYFLKNFFIFFKIIAETKKSPADKRVNRGFKVLKYGLESAGNGHIALA